MCGDPQHRIFSALLHVGVGLGFCAPLLAVLWRFGEENRLVFCRLVTWRYEVSQVKCSLLHGTDLRRSPSAQLGKLKRWSADEPAGRRRRSRVLPWDV